MCIYIYTYPLYTYPLSSAEYFSPEISNFSYIKKYKYRLHFYTWFLILLTLFESLKVVLINMVAIFMMSAKLATLGLFKIKLYRNKGYDIAISVHDDVTNKILSCESENIVDVVIWPKFGNTSISMREVIITSIYNDFTRKKKQFF